MTVLGVVAGLAVFVPVLVLLAFAEAATDSALDDCLGPDDER